MKPSNVLILPGWQNSGPQHWQSLWEQRHGYVRVEQHDWDHPLRGDWITRLEEVILSRDEPVVLVAHSLGCLLAVHWATRTGGSVRGALLVAPPDPAVATFPAQAAGFTPLPLTKLPFRSTLIYSTDDPYCSPGRARVFAAAWGSEALSAGAGGVIPGLPPLPGASAANAVPASQNVSTTAVTAARWGIGVRIDMGSPACRTHRLEVEGRGRDDRSGIAIHASAILVA